MSRCQFTTKYFDDEIGKYVDFNCPEEALSSGFCIFHDKDYLQDKTNNEEHKRKVLNRLKYKVNHAISNNESLLCIGFQLPDFILLDLNISKEFTKPVYFIGSQFCGDADFYGAHFEKDVQFTGAHFQGRVTFSKAEFEGITEFSEANFEGQTDFNHSEFYRKTYFSGQFNGETKFHYVLFEGKEKVIFDVEDLSNVSFMNTDLTGVRFSDKARWGKGRGEKAKEDRFKIVDERLLEQEIKENDGHIKKTSI